ncbi:MAG: hypothetical protein JXB88_20470 [Spirochaetales bacterium]|nr:hypothetical protein [Spirochaetales bacterium]
MDTAKQNTKKSDELDILHYLGIFFRYKFLILFITGGISILGMLFLFITKILPPQISILPDVYTPTAMILVNERTMGDIYNSLLSATSLVSSRGIGSGIPERFSYGALAVKLLRSNQILDKIAEEFQLQKRYKLKHYVKSQSRNILKTYLSASYDDETMTVTITYKDHDPYFASNIVNRVIELLDQRFISIGGHTNILRKDLLENKIAEVAAKIQFLEYKVQEFQKKYGVLDVQSLAVEHVTMMARFRSQLIIKEMEINTYSEFSRIEDTVLRRLKTERDNLLKLIEEFESGFSEYQGVFPAQQELPEIALEFSHMQRDLLLQEKIHSTLIQQYEIVNLSLEGEEPLFQILERADVPDLKTGPRRSILAIVITFAGFIVSMASVLIINSIKSIKSDPGQLKRLKGLD